MGADDREVGRAGEGNQHQMNATNIPLDAITGLIYTAFRGSDECSLINHGKLGKFTRMQFNFSFKSCSLLDFSNELGTHFKTTINNKINK